MKNISLLLMLTSCISFRTTSTVTRKTFYTIGGEQVEEKELEIDENSYKLVDKVELGKREIYKIYREDQKNIEDMADNYIKEIVNEIASKINENEDLIEEFCQKLKDRGVTSKRADGTEGYIREYVEEKLIYGIYVSIQEGIAQELNKEEINRKIEEKLDTLPSYHEVHVKINNFVKKLFNENKNSFSVYESTKTFSLPSRMDSSTKSKIFGSIVLKKYNDLHNLLLSNKGYYKEIIINSLNKLENDHKFIALKNVFASQIYALKINTRSLDLNIEEGSKKSSLGNLAFREDKKVYFKGVPLVLRKYKKK